MPLAHLAIGSRDVRATADFLCRVMGWEMISAASNAPLEVAWIDLSPPRDRTQQIHVIYVENFEISPFDCEFGRHLAVLHEGADMAALRRRITQQGGELIAPVRPTPFERFFFREPINGYIFEVIHQQQWTSEQPDLHPPAMSGLPAAGPTVAERLRTLGIELPSPPPAVGAYRPWSRTGDLVFTSGQLPWKNGQIAYAGRLGENLSTDDGYQAARLCAINALAQIKDAIGDLERVVQIARLEGFVHCAPGFRGHPEVLNGASHLIDEIFGQRNKHSRLAVGIADMPLDAAVQLVLVSEVRD